MTIPIAVPSYYGLGEILAEVFDDGMLADDLAIFLTYIEVNVLAGFLHTTGHHDGADHWLRSHQAGCDAPTGTKASLPDPGDTPGPASAQHRLEWPMHSPARSPVHGRHALRTRRRRGRRITGHATQ
ncbi:hypothetical protein E1202_11960 [Saccharopolyspora karakumensis]|uniref:Uncharacterized protein n=1 Tax=Saccharopolyspora karakumensis TaxID=2530386 RepID=A0A4V2YXM4_9PSEU|nr:hypothetical protein [Saccharopolyspora karakumensis]TDD89217.1 hypothetical protein E1202_11960 [Saccharopolyspora karakumensis]